MENKKYRASDSQGEPVLEPRGELNPDPMLIPDLINRGSGTGSSLLAAHEWFDSISNSYTKARLAADGQQTINVGIRS